MFSVVLGSKAMSKLYAWIDQPRPSPSCPRLPVCGSVPPDFPVGLDWTEPDCKPGSSGLVESSLGSTLPDIPSRGKTLPISLDYVLLCMLLCAWSRGLLSCRCQTLGGMRQVVGGVCQVAGGWWHRVAKISTSGDIIVWNDSFAWPLWPDLTMPHGYGVYNCSLGFCQKGWQFDIGESRSQTKICQRHLLFASHQFWAYVCAFGLGHMVLRPKEYWYDKGK